MQYKYTVAESVPVRESKSVQAITTGKTSDASADKTGGNLTLQSFYTAEAAQANEYGPYEVVEGKGLDYQNSLAQNVLISEALAKKNNLKVGSTITIGNPTDAKKTYEYTVVGIYRYTGNPDNAQGDDAKFAKDNRNNVLYTTYTTFAVNGFDTTKGKGWSIPGINVVFTFQNRSDIDKFAAALKADLPKGFTVSSPTITHYMQSIEALGTLAGTTRIIMIVLWICGALALLGLVLLAALPALTRSAWACSSDSARDVSHGSSCLRRSCRRSSASPWAWCWAHAPPTRWQAHWGLSMTFMQPVASYGR